MSLFTEIMLKSQLAQNAHSHCPSTHGPYEDTDHTEASTSSASGHFKKTLPDKDLPRVAAGGEA